MPEGDTIFRTARTLQRALAGQTVTRFARELARKLAEVAIRRQTRRTGLLIGEINDAPARDHFLALFLEEAGFVLSPLGFQMRRVAEPT